MRINPRIGTGMTTSTKQRTTKKMRVFVFVLMESYAPIYKIPKIETFLIAG
jgi:hypothetical protein